MEYIAQFYNVELNKAHTDGWPFPADTEGPEGPGWVKVVSKKRLAVPKLAKKARKIMQLIQEM